MPSRVVATPLMLLGSAAFASAADTYVWQTGSYYFDGLPPAGTPTCCGSQLVGDPNSGDNGNLCLCDVTSNYCDVDCCCDPDCTFDSLRRGGVFGCVDNSTETTLLSYTLCSDNLVSTNIPNSVRDQGLVDAFGGPDGLLCVVSDNSPARGEFLRDPVADGPLQPQEVLQQLNQRQPFSYGGWLDPDAPTSPQPFYEIDIPLKGEGILLPAPSADGTCSGQQSLPYLRNVPKFACDLVPPGPSPPSFDSLEVLRSLCATTLNATFLRTAGVASRPAVWPPDVPVALETRELTLGSATSFGAAGTVPSPTFDSIAGVCIDALLGYELRLVVDGGGSLTGATAYATFGTVSQDVLTSTRTSYAAAFEYATGVDTLIRPTSGRPGYQRGLPLLVAEGDALRTGGLRMLPRSATGECAAGHGGSSVALFGEDHVASCTYSFSLSELESFCTSGPKAAAHPLIASLNVSNTFIGAYGDSHPSVTGDWVPLTVRYETGDASLTSSWNDASKTPPLTCSGVLSTINLRLLYTEVGSVALPIPKIVGAEIGFGFRDLAARRCPMGKPCKTVLAVTATTTFTRLDSSSYEFIPASPQLIPPLPYDFFYPFTSSSS